MTDVRLRLDGWKAIADRLGRTVRTVQRWQRDRGLPVYRVAGGKVATVFAFADELDGWLSQQPPNLDAPNGTTSATPHSAGGFATWRRPAVLVGALLLCLVAVGGWLLFARFLRSQVVAAEFKGDELVALDKRGGVAWTYRFDPEVRTPLLLRVHHPMKPLAAVADLNGDGSREVVVIRNVRQGSSTDASGDDIYCLSGGGRLLWHYHAGATFVFAGRQFEGPWDIGDWLIREEGGRRTIWVAFCHNTWWPSFVLKLDENGRAETPFVSAGHIFALTAIRSAEGELILAGGINNEQGAAMVAVLDPNAAAASTPQLDPQYRCDHCPATGPSRFFVFPRSELNAAAHLPYNSVWTFSPVADGVRINTLENQLLEADLMYMLRPTLALASVARSDGYSFGHRELERSGVLQHSLDTCPERLGITVKVWQPRTGWSNVLVPMAK